MRKFWYYAASSAGATSLLLDLFPAPVAYSVYKIRSNYSGPCVRVRRASDNSELDVFFSNGIIDEQAIIDFKTFSTENITIVIWYNQGFLGNICDATQTILTVQPFIAGATTPTGITRDTEGNISIYFDAGNLVFGDGSVFRFKNYGAAFCVYDNVFQNIRRDIYSWLQPTSGSIRFFATDNFNQTNRHQLLSARVDGTPFVTLSSPSPYNTGTKQRSDIINWGVAEASIRINNNVIVSSSSYGTSGNTSDTDSRVVMSSDNTSGIGSTYPSVAVRYISELIFYNDILTIDDINSVEQNQMLRYATT